MAIHPKLHQHSAQQGSLTPQQAHAISTWTEQATESLESLDISADNAATAGTVNVAPRQAAPLLIPIDDHHPNPSVSVRVRPAAGVVATETKRIIPSAYGRREPLHRDSLKRREALLKGKEGSRRRQRWENDRLMSNPWAQAPSASDWQVQPSYPRHGTVPYYLAPLWDSHYAQKEQARGSRSKRTGKGKDTAADPQHQIPKELRTKLKRARAAHGLLQDLEEDIRAFVEKWNDKQSITEGEGLADAPVDSDDEDEIVFVGRNGQMHDSPGRKSRIKHMDQEMGVDGEKDNEKVVFESLVDDRGGIFGRWIVHSLATYYGLRTWSVTRGNPARRVAYVGISNNRPLPNRKLSYSQHTRTTSSSSAVSCRYGANTQHGDMLPRPLWGMV
ncbi:hypothetical protein FQN54_002398 [Arachnomyces sp. PD_36]|nr:hypothetical protein FQN54_002398 [Arachnomyces sp. PD_36]